MTGQPNNPKTPAEQAGASETPTKDQEVVTYTAAQLRMARRKARRMGLNPANGRQAMEMLNERGIGVNDKEPSLTDSMPGAQGAQQQNPAEAGQSGQPTPAGAQPGAAAGAESSALMAQKKSDNVPAAQVLGAQTPAVISNDDRKKEIAKLEKKIRQRRDTKVRRMLRRFFLFVLLPTILLGIYYYRIATPLFGANSDMKVEQASAASTGGVGSLLQGTSFASAPEAIAVQNYLQSRNAYERLQEDYPFDELFMGDDVDMFLRLDEEAKLEDRYDLYGKQVKISYDNTDQIIRLEVRSPTAESAIDVSKLLISYAEERVDNQTQRLRDTGVKEAEVIVQEKLDDLDEAQNKIFEIQEQQGTLSPTADKEVLLAEIGGLRTQLTQQKLVLAQLQDVASPNRARVNAVQAEINRLENAINTLTTEGTTVDEDGVSIARLDQEMRLAEMRLGLAQQEYELASTNLQVAESEARSQRRFITTSLPPTATFEPIYPKKLMSTVSAFFVFFAIYLFASITIEVIREQVSA